MNGVLCDPRLPEDWDEREKRLQLARQIELAHRQPELSEPEILTIFRRAAAL